MLIQSLTTDKISLVTEKAGNVHVVACFTDRDQTTGAVGASDRQLTSIVTATTTDIVAVPGASTTRKIDSLHICNANTVMEAAGGQHTITVQFNANGTLYELYKAALWAGDILQYTEGVGFEVVEFDALLDRTLITTSDQVFNNDLLFVNVTGLEYDLFRGFNDIDSGNIVMQKPGTRYNFLAHIYHISAASTTGARFGILAGNQIQELRASSIDCIAGTANTAATLASGTVVATNTTIIAETTGVAIVAMCIISGYLIVPAQTIVNSRFAILLAPEVAANMTVKRGSWLRIWEDERKY